MRAHAQGISETAIRQHVDLSVNRYSIDLGEDGRRAVEKLFEKGRAAGLIPDTKDPFLGGV